MNETELRALYETFRNRIFDPYRGYTVTEQAASLIVSYGSLAAAHAEAVSLIYPIPGGFWEQVANVLEQAR